MKKFLSRLFPSEVYYVNTSLTSHELTRVFMAKCCRPATSKLVMRFFFASAAFSQCTVDHTVQLLVSIVHRVCSSKGKRNEARYICKSCCVPLHVDDCYTVYHTKKKY